MKVASRSFVFLVLSLVLAYLPLASESYAARTCIASEKESADKKLWLNEHDKAEAIAEHLPWGAPEPTTPNGHEELFVQRDYVNNYDHTYMIPIWTAHRVDVSRLGKVGRVDCFRRDPRIDKPTASLPSDYTEPIFDQGHLTPSGDMTKALTPVLNSFVLSNMAPQYCQFNRGVWQIFESMVRLWSEDYGILYVITGSVFDWNGDDVPDAPANVPRMQSNNGKTRVAVPSHFYKVVLFPSDDGEIYSVTVMLPHDQTDLSGDEAVDYLNRHVVPLSAIERRAGIRFPFSSDHESDALWEYSGTLARSTVDDRCRATGGHSF